jgi:hypothetical protein
MRVVLEVDEYHDFNLITTDRMLQKLTSFDSVLSGTHKGALAIG